MTAGPDGTAGAPGGGGADPARPLVGPGEDAGAGGGPVDPAAAPLSATATTARGAVDPAAAPLAATADRESASSPARSLLPDALRAFTAAVDAAARADGWALPTPSTGWDVRAVVGHVAAQQARAPHLLGRGAGHPAPDGDLLGPDPRQGWRALAAASTVAWATAPQDARVVIAGEDAPASELAERLLLDLVVHAWDVRRALAAGGADVDERPDATCVEHCLGWVRSHQRLLAGSGRFGTPREAASGEPLDQLLALVGRGS